MVGATGRGFLSSASEGTYSCRIFKKDHYGQILTMSV